MRRTIVYAVAATLAIGGGLAALRPAGAQPSSTTEKKTTTQVTKTTTAAVPAGGDLRAMVDRQVEAAQKKLVALAEATPAEKYGWRPGEGVRSTGEVFMHVASANYFLPTFWGAQVPAGVDPRTLEKDGGDKAKTVAALKASFDSVRQAIAAAPASDLGKPVKIFGHDATVGEVMLGVASHCHEHLGQAIAYARVNGIVPPWSAAEGARGGR